MPEEQIVNQSLASGWEHWGLRGVSEPSFKPCSNPLHIVIKGGTKLLNQRSNLQTASRVNRIPLLCSGNLEEVFMASIRASFNNKIADLQSGCLTRALANGPRKPASKECRLAQVTTRERRVQPVLVPTARLSVQPLLPEALQLHRLNYLDALLLFWSERERATADGLKDRSTALDQILWLLAVLYPLDPLWARAEHYQARHRLMLDAIDCALHLTGEESPGSHWDWCRREAMIFDQQWHLQEHMKKHPQGLRTAKDRMRYLARVWFWRPHKQPNE